MSARPTASTYRSMDKKTVMNELREVLLGVACQIVLTTGKDAPGEDYLGISLEEYSLGSMPGSFRDDLAAVDLTRFNIAHQISWAYDFALQTGDMAARGLFGDDDWNDLGIFLGGGPRIGFGSESTPLQDENSALRRTIDMALARMHLLYGYSLTIRELALLADIGETAVRTSLSADGIRTEGKPAQISADVAEPWLRRRRGFVPTLNFGDNIPSIEAFAATALFDNGGFDIALLQIMATRSLDRSELAQLADVSEQWLKDLVEGSRVACDVGALGRLAKVLEVDAPMFVGRAIETILRRG